MDGFLPSRLVEMADADHAPPRAPALEAARERDHAWMGAVIAEHYAGADTNVRSLLAGVLAAFAGISVEEFQDRSAAFLRAVCHPTLGRAYVDCAYAPMVEFLDYLQANGFAKHIARAAGETSCARSASSSTGSPASG